MLSSLVRLLIVSTALLTASAQTNPFENEIRAFEAADAASPPPANSVLFVGSSSIVNWRTVVADFPQYAVLNRGFGGSQTSDLLFFFDRIVARYRPAIIVFYEGDNDIAAGEPVQQVFNEWTNFMGRVKSALPNTHVVYVSVKPSPSREADLPDQRELNDKVRQSIASDEKFHFADVFTPMLTDTGEFRPELYVADRLHMTDAGYAIWRSVVGPILAEISAGYPIPLTRPETGSLLIDFGSPDLLSGADATRAITWNNVSASFAASAASSMQALDTAGDSNGVQLQMVSRFNGANENGTTGSTHYPASATRDSLFGNTETFSGLANITPIFKLAGLDPAAAYRLTFFASRTGVSDNRQTRYTATGAASGFVDLNAANNVSQRATLGDVAPDANGAITIALTPGPANNNANHFTYLGVLGVETIPAGPIYLFDFGANNSLTQSQPGNGLFWNNVTLADALVENLVATNGSATTIDLQVTSAFQVANQDLAASHPEFPASAVRDFLAGNNAAFKLRGLNPVATYNFQVYSASPEASQYLFTGDSTVSANLIDQIALVSGLKPDSNREINVSLGSIGALKISWTTANVRAIKLTAGNGLITVEGAPGMTYQLQTSADLQTWVNWRQVTLATGSETVTAEGLGTVFVRALQ